MPGAVVFDGRHDFYRAAISAESGSRAVGIIRDLASQDELQAALLHPGRLMGWGVELLCGVAAAWHRLAGKELELDLVLRCSEEGQAPRVVAREHTGVSLDRQAPVQLDLIDGGPVELYALVSEDSRAGVENGLDERGEASSDGGGVACPLESAPL